MNIARGLFRLWIALTGMWLIFVVWFTYDTINSIYYPSRTYYFLKDVTKAQEQAAQDQKRARTPSTWGNFEITTPGGFAYDMRGSSGEDAYSRLIATLPTAPYRPNPVVAESYGEVYRSLEDGVTRKATQRISIHGFPEITLYVDSSTNEAEKEKLVEAAHATAVENKAAVIAERKKSALRTAAISGVLPPAVLFFIGWVAIWIARGFKR